MTDLKMEYFAAAEPLLQTQLPRPHARPPYKAVLYVARRPPDSDLIYAVVGPLISGAHLYGPEDQLRAIGDYLVNAQHIMAKAGAGPQCFDVGDIENLRRLALSEVVGDAEFQGSDDHPALQPKPDPET